MNRRGLWVAVGGAAATLAGSLLPWATGPFGIAVNGTSGDGILTLILSVPMALFAWLALRQRWAAIAVIVPSVLTLALMTYEVIHISTIQYAALGVGVIVCLGGGVAGVVGGVLERRDFVVPQPAPSQSAPAAGHMSPDGSYWWNGSQWIAMPLQAGSGDLPSAPPWPQSARIVSPDGRYWWDGGQWQVVQRGTTPIPL